MKAILTFADADEESAAEVQCIADSADGGIIWLEWRKARRKSECTVLKE